MVFQHFNLVPRHTVLSNVLTGCLGRTSAWRSIFGLYSAEDKAMAMRYLELVGIKEKAYMRATQLSGGQQQRVSIARAIAHHPHILFADEPTANLDSANSALVMQSFLDLNSEGQTIIMITHEEEYARRAKRVVTLKDGQIVKDEK
jgi:phosphonate transport system ATP-binding protein